MNLQFFSTFWMVNPVQKERSKHGGVSHMLEQQGSCRPHLEGDMGARPGSSEGFN